MFKAKRVSPQLNVVRVRVSLCIFIFFLVFLIKIMECSISFPLYPVYVTFVWEREIKSWGYGNFHTCQWVKYSSRKREVFRIDLRSWTQQVWEHLSGRSHVWLSSVTVKKNSRPSWMTVWTVMSIVANENMNWEKFVLRIFMWLQQKKDSVYTFNYIS